MSAVSQRPPWLSINVGPLRHASAIARDPTGVLHSPLADTAVSTRVRLLDIGRSCPAVDAIDRGQTLFVTPSERIVQKTLVDS